MKVSMMCNVYLIGRQIKTSITQMRGTITKNMQGA